jgi:hypothetical protein
MKLFQILCLLNYLIYFSLGESPCLSTTYTKKIESNTGASYTNVITGKHIVGRGFDMLQGNPFCLN